MFANCQLMGTDLAFPDVCLTPSPVGPVPIPYPNIAMGPTAVPNVPTILFMGAPAHNMGTTIPMTNGDNAGVATGVASGMVMGPAKAMLGVMKILVEGQPGIHLTTQFGHNGASPNCPAGVQVAPSQTKVIFMG